MEGTGDFRGLLTAANRRIIMYISERSGEHALIDDTWPLSDYEGNTALLLAAIYN